MSSIQATVQSAVQAAPSVPDHENESVARSLNAVATRAAAASSPPSGDAKAMLVAVLKQQVTEALTALENDPAEGANERKTATLLLQLLGAATGTAGGPTAASPTAVSPTAIAEQIGAALLDEIRVIGADALLRDAASDGPTTVVEALLEAAAGPVIETAAGEKGTAVTLLALRLGVTEAEARSVLREVIRYVVDFVVAHAVEALAGLRWVPRPVLGLIDAPHTPGVPLVGIAAVVETLGKLAGRGALATPAKQGLSSTYSLGGYTNRPAYDYLYGTVCASPYARHDALSQILALVGGGATSAAASGATELGLLAGQFGGDAAGDGLPPTSNVVRQRPTTQLALTEAEQWTMSWTHYGGIYERALHDGLGTRFAKALDPKKPTDASAAFWPTLAEYGLAYNLTFLQAVDAAALGDLKTLFAETWDEAWDDEALYMIDLRVFTRDLWDPETERFTPSTVTVLRRDASGSTWSLTPVAVYVQGEGGDDAEAYVEADPAWVWALQAARASATVYGIWIGHVYHWHMIPAAAFQALTASDLSLDHPVRRLLEPQAEFVREFDEVLLLTWKTAAPPTSFVSAASFLRLMSDVAEDHPVSLKSPTQALADQGIEPADFSHDGADWAHYPTIPAYEAVWDAAATYVGAVVEAAYPDDAAVAADGPLQAWIGSLKDTNGANLTFEGSSFAADMTTKAGLRSLLTSLIYRVTIHGTDRLLDSLGPGLAHLGNFPPCLQSDAIPTPDTQMAAEDLFRYMPRTGTIGLMLNFYYEFVFSPPYVPMIPFEGVEAPQFLGTGAQACNEALADFRRTIRTLIETLGPNPAPGLPSRYQWPRSVET